MNEKNIYNKKPETESAEIVEDNKKCSDAEIAGDSWAEDQNKKSYYYDDSYGYEVYNPDDEDEESE